METTIPVGAIIITTSLLKPTVHDPENGTGLRVKARATVNGRSVEAVVGWDVSAGVNRHRGAANRLCLDNGLELLDWYEKVIEPFNKYSQQESRQYICRPYVKGKKQRAGKQS